MDTFKKTWEYIDKTRNKDQWLKSIEDWNNLEKKRNEHSDCKDYIRSYCKVNLCKHFSNNVCSMYGVCSWCDNLHQPMLANPNNKKYVLKYCKLGSSILYPDEP